MLTTTRWFGTIWNARIPLTASMLFALGLVSLFLSGGLSGIFLARNDLTRLLRPAVSKEDFGGNEPLVYRGA